jgi:uncharacterized protein YbcI
VARQQSASSVISREIVRLHAQFYGRGPTQAKTYIHPDFVLCALEDVSTPSELTLIEARKEGLVRENRVAFQDVIRSQFVSTVEQAIGRRVRAFYNQIDPGSNTAAEVFLLAPATEPAETGADRDLMSSD